MFNSIFKSERPLTDPNKNRISNSDLEGLKQRQRTAWGNTEKPQYSPFSQLLFEYPEAISPAELENLGFKPVKTVNFLEENPGTFIFVKGTNAHAYYLLQIQSDRSILFWRAFHQPTPAISANNATNAIVSWKLDTGQYYAYPGQLMTEAMISWPYYQTNSSQVPLLGQMWESQVSQLWVRGVSTTEDGDGIVDSLSWSQEVRNSLLRQVATERIGLKPIPTSPSLFFAGLSPEKALLRFDTQTPEQVAQHINLLARLLLSLFFLTERNGIDIVYKLTRSSLYDSPRVSQSEWTLARLKSVFPINSFFVPGLIESSETSRILVSSPSQLITINNGNLFDEIGNLGMTVATQADLELVKRNLTQKAEVENKRRANGPLLTLVEGGSDQKNKYFIMLAESILRESRTEKDTIIHGARLNYFYDLFQTADKVYGATIGTPLKLDQVQRLVHLISKLPEVGYEALLLNSWEYLQSIGLKLTAFEFSEIVTIVFGSSWFGTGENFGGTNSSGSGFHGGILLK
ncbi:hypothetical protein KBC89_05435 [Candidatus Woesebacteria bacterium]|nr:hypothetical protein [Candidatus Woesebacteria bacterium]